MQKIAHSMQKIAHSMQKITHSMQKVAHSMQKIAHSMQKITHNMQYRYVRFHCAVDSFEHVDGFLSFISDLPIYLKLFTQYYRAGCALLYCV